MTVPPLTRVVILGGGKGGSALLDLLLHIPEVDVIGVADKDPAAPAFQRAQSLDIQATTNVLDLICDPSVGLLIDVTGDPRVDPLIREHKHPTAEVLTGAAARLLLNLVNRESQIQNQLFQSEKLAGIGTFASGLAHDINNPLYLILGLAEELQEEDDPQVIKGHALDISRAVKRISALTKELTNYARKNSDHDLVPVELTAKLDEAARISLFASGHQHLSIIKNYAARPLINANPDDVLHLFVNLMTNAIYAMNGQGTLTLKTGWERHQAFVAVSDTGCGIPKDHLEKIFDPFFTTKSPGKGTGLGLHNVLALTTRFQGKVSVDSEIGQGTTFNLTFPTA